MPRPEIDPGTWETVDRVEPAFGGGNALHLIVPDQLPNVDAIQAAEVYGALINRQICLWRGQKEALGYHFQLIYP